MTKLTEKCKEHRFHDVKGDLREMYAYLRATIISEDSPSVYCLDIPAGVIPLLQYIFRFINVKRQKPVCE
jgi:hypothetical protein